MSILLFTSTLIYLLSRILMVIVIDVPSLCWRLWERISREAFSTMGCCWCKWLLQLCCIPGMACSDWQTQFVSFCGGSTQHLQWLLRTMNEHACTMLIIKVETGRVDGQRLCVTGESAGGFTTLACLAFRQTFKAGFVFIWGKFWFSISHALLSYGFSLTPAKNLYMRVLLCL